MTGAVTVAAIVCLLILLSGVALGWYLRRANHWCSACGEQLGCEGCRSGAAWPRQHMTTSSH